MAGTKARSARGVLVDFDILRIREKLANAPKPVTVKERENYIESKTRRRRKKKTETEKKDENLTEEKKEEKQEEENNENKAEE